LLTAIPAANGCKFLPKHDAITQKTLLENYYENRNIRNGEE
jgi:hypothetical protein